MSHEMWLPDFHPGKDDKPKSKQEKNLMELKGT